MNQELIQVIEQISRERGISKKALLETLESALLSAARKKYGIKPTIDIKIDPKNGNIRITALKKVVDKITNPKEEITISEARKLEPDKGIGDEVETLISLCDFGRIAVQTAKQVLFQKTREAEMEIIYSEFKARIRQIANGVVLRKEKGIYFISLGRAEAMLPQKETLPNETLKRGDTIRVYIEDVKITAKGPVILLSRGHPNLVVELFKMEVPEIYDGLVVIKNIVREAGERTKLTVYSKDPKVDPVGACVGMKGTRVQSIVRELKGERIDIIPWTDNPRDLIAKALSPATVEKIGINEEEKSALVVVNDQQLSLAIGKKGQNVRLAMKLTGWDIDIISNSEYDKIKIEETEKHLEESLKRGQRKEDEASKDEQS
ncbi:MAG TPA: transcription termination/antitermination protein NusA [Nitrospiraceae bacterium]|nr:transcription termination/antitermination protein NusA [Nitrospiraceae bacterium]